MPGRL
jgi:alpha-amylase